VTSITEKLSRQALKRSYAEGNPMSHNNAFGIQGHVSRGFESMREVFTVQGYRNAGWIRPYQFSTTARSESYGLVYLDYSPGTDWEKAVNTERDSILNGLGGSVVNEKRTSVVGYPGKWIRFVGQNTSGELTIYFVGQRLYVLHAFAPKNAPRPENFSTFLNSFRLLSEPKP
jgi:hypothetical protein